MRRHRQAGFTLLEVLLVAMLMGLVATAVVLSMGGARGDRELDQQARRLMATLQQAQEYSVMDGRLVGLRIEANGWQFMQRGAKDRKWQALTDDKPADHPAHQEQVHRQRDEQDDQECLAAHHAPSPITTSDKSS